MDSSNLILRVQDFNVTATKPEFIAELYTNTLYAGKRESGMTYELRNLLQKSKSKLVDARIILAHKNEEMAAWALLSREESYFLNNGFDSDPWFDPAKDGTLLEIFVKPQYRRQGIGTEIVKLARRKAKPYKLCFVPWDTISHTFYGNFKHYDHRLI
jgi:GNAT superfamily N-acetyltransferase